MASVSRYGCCSLTIRSFRTAERGPSFVIVRSHFVGYNRQVFTVLQTEEFEGWLDGLADRKARGIIRDRILRIEGGKLGKGRSTGGKVSEVKIDYGPGYRLYFTRIGLVVIVLLCGGDKSSQRADIKRARAMAGDLPGKLID